MPQTRKTRLRKKSAYAAKFRATHLTAERARVREAAAALRKHRLTLHLCLDCGCKLTGEAQQFIRCRKHREQRAKAQAAYRQELASVGL